MKYIFASFLLFTGCLLAVGDSQRIPPHAQRNYEEYLDSVLGGADHEGTNRGDFLDYAYTGGRRPLARPKQRRERRLDDDPDIYYDDEEYYYDYEEADDYYNDDDYDENDDYYDNDDDLNDEVNNVGDLNDEVSELKDANDPIDNDLDPDDEEFLHDNMIHKDDDIRSKVKVGKANADARFKVKGKPGVDYPALKFLPETSFKCEGRALGYYADMETRCQVFHVCEPGNAQHDFLCPEGTIFNQKYIVCDWWYNVDCPRSPEFFELNEDFFKDGKVTSPPLPSTSMVIPSSFGTASQPSQQQQQQQQHQRRKQRRRKQRPKQQLQALISSSPITEVPLIAASTQRSPQAKVYVAPEQPNADQVSKPAAERTYIPPLPPNSEQSSRAERLRASRGPSGVPEVNERLSVPQALYQTPVVSEASAGNREAITNSVGLSYNAPPRVSTSTDKPGDRSNGQRKQRISSQRRKNRNRDRIRSRTKPLGQGLAVEVQYRIGNDGMRFPDDAASRLTDSQPDDPPTSSGAIGPRANQQSLEPPSPPSPSPPPPSTSSPTPVIPDPVSIPKRPDIPMPSAIPETPKDPPSALYETPAKPFQTRCETPHNSTSSEYETPHAPPSPPHSYTAPPPKIHETPHAPPSPPHSYPAPPPKIHETPHAPPSPPHSYISPPLTTYEVALSAPDVAPVPPKEFIPNVNKIPQRTLQSLHFPESSKELQNTYLPSSPQMSPSSVPATSLSHNSQSLTSEHPKHSAALILKETLHHYLDQQPQEQTQNVQIHLHIHPGSDKISLSAGESKSSSGSTIERNFQLDRDPVVITNPADPHVTPKPRLTFITSTVKVNTDREIIHSDESPNKHHESEHNEEYHLHSKSLKSRDRHIAKHHITNAHPNPLLTPPPLPQQNGLHIKPKSISGHESEPATIPSPLVESSPAIKTEVLRYHLPNALGYPAHQVRWWRPRRKRIRYPTSSLPTHNHLPHHESSPTSPHPIMPKHRVNSPMYQSTTKDPHLELHKHPPVTPKVPLTAKLKYPSSTPFPINLPKAHSYPTPLPYHSLTSTKDVSAHPTPNHLTTHSSTLPILHPHTKAAVSEPPAPKLDETYFHPHIPTRPSYSTTKHSHPAPAYKHSTHHKHHPTNPPSYHSELHPHTSKPHSHHTSPVPKHTSSIPYPSPTPKTHIVYPDPVKSHPESPHAPPEAKTYVKYMDPVKPHPENPQSPPTVKNYAIYPDSQTPHPPVHLIPPTANPYNSYLPPGSKTYVIHPESLALNGGTPYSHTPKTFVIYPDSPKIHSPNHLNTPPTAAPHPAYYHHSKSISPNHNPSAPPVSHYIHPVPSTPRPYHPPNEHSHTDHYSYNTQQPRYNYRHPHLPSSPTPYTYTTHPLVNPNLHHPSKHEYDHPALGAEPYYANRHHHPHHSPPIYQHGSQYSTPLPSTHLSPTLHNYGHLHHSHQHSIPNAYPSVSYSHLHSNPHPPSPHPYSPSSHPYSHYQSPLTPHPYHHISEPHRKNYSPPETPKSHEPPHSQYHHHSHVALRHPPQTSYQSPDSPLVKNPDHSLAPNPPPKPSGLYEIPQPSTPADLYHSTPLSVMGIYPSSTPHPAYPEGHPHPHPSLMPSVEVSKPNITREQAEQYWAKYYKELGKVFAYNPYASNSGSVSPHNSHGEHGPFPPSTNSFPQEGDLSLLPQFLEGSSPIYPPNVTLQEHPRPHPQHLLQYPLDTLGPHDYPSAPSAIPSSARLKGDIRKPSEYHLRSNLSLSSKSYFPVDTLHSNAPPVEDYPSNFPIPAPPEAFLSLPNPVANYSGNLSSSPGANSPALPDTPLKPFDPSLDASVFPNDSHHTRMRRPKTQTSSTDRRENSPGSPTNDNKQPRHQTILGTRLNNKDIVFAKPQPTDGISPLISLFSALDDKPLTDFNKGEGAYFDSRQTLFRNISAQTAREFYDVGGSSDYHGYDDDDYYYYYDEGEDYGTGQSGSLFLEDTDRASLRPRSFESHGSNQAGPHPFGRGVTENGNNAVIAFPSTPPSALRQRPPKRSPPGGAFFNPIPDLEDPAFGIPDFLHLDQDWSMKIGSKKPLPSQSPFPHSSHQTHSRARVSVQQGLQRDVRHPSSSLYHPHNLYHQAPLYGGWNTSLHSSPLDYGGGVEPDYYDYDYEDHENGRDSEDPYHEYNNDKVAYNVANYHYSISNFGREEENQTPKTVHMTAMTPKNAPVTPTVLTYTTAAPNYVSPFPQSQTVPRHLILKASDPTLHHSGVLLKENPVTPTVVTYTSPKPTYPLPHPASEIRTHNSLKHSGVISQHAAATPDKDSSVPDVLAYLTSKASYPSSSLMAQTRLRQPKQNLQRANSRYKAPSPQYHHEMPRHKNVREQPQTITTSSKYSLQEHHSKAIYDPKDYTTPSTFTYETKSHSPSTPSYQDITDPSHVLLKEYPTGRPLRSPKLPSISHSLPVYGNTYALTNLEEKHLQQDTLYSHSEEVNPDLFNTKGETSANREAEGKDNSPKENFAPLKKPSITFYSSEETDPDPNVEDKMKQPINTHHTSTMERNLFNQHNNQYSYNPPSNVQGYYNHYWGNNNYRNYFTDPYANSQNTFTGSRAYSGPNVAGTEDTTSTSGNLLAARGQYFNPVIQSDISAYYPQEILRQYYLDSYTYLSNLRRNDSLSQIYKENPYTRRFMGVAPKFMSTTGPYPPKPRLSFDTVDDNITGLHVNQKHVYEADPTEFVSSVGGNIEDLTIQTSTQIPEHLTPVTLTALSMESFKSEETPTATHLTTRMPFRAAEITTAYNPELNSVTSVLDSELKGNPKHNGSIATVYSTAGPSSPKMSLLELYPFKRPDPSRYFSETSTSVNPLKVTPGNKPKNVNPVVSTTRVRNASPRPKPIRRRKPKLIPDNIAENKHRNVTAGAHRKHPTLPRKYLPRRQRPTSPPVKSIDENPDSESKPVTLDTHLSQEISKSKSTANVRNQRNKKLVKRRRRPSQARISLLNSTHKSPPASHSSSPDSSTPYIPSTVTPTKGYLSSTENSLHGIPETLTSVQSPKPSTSDIDSSNEMKHNPSSGVASLEMLVEKPIPPLPTLASSSIDSTTNEEKKSPLPHHDLQHPVIPQTTLVQGETSSHSPLPIPTGGNKSLPGPISGLPRRDPNDPTGDRSTGPNPTQTSPIYSKTVNRNNTSHIYNNTIANIYIQTQHTVNNTLRKTHLNETLLELYINNLTHQNLTEISRKLSPKMYVNSSHLNRTTNIPYSLKQERSNSFEHHHTPDLQLASGSSFSHISYLPPLYQYQMENQTGEIIPNVQLTLNINVPLQKYLSDILNPQILSSGYSLTTKEALPFHEPHSVKNGPLLTTTIKPIHTIKTGFGSNNKDSSPLEASSAKTNSNSLSLSHSARELPNAHWAQTTSKPTTYADPARGDVVGVPTTHSPLVFPRHKHLHNSHFTNRQQRHRMLMNQYFKQRFRPFSHRRPSDISQLLHGPVVRTRYLRSQRNKPTSASFQNINFGLMTTVSPKHSIDTLSPDKVVTPKIPDFHLVSTPPAPISHNGQESLGNYQRNNEKIVYPGKQNHPSTVVTMTNHYNPFHYHSGTEDASSSLNSPPPIHKIHGYLPTSSPHFRGNGDNPYLLYHSIHKSNAQLSNTHKEQYNHHAYLNHGYPSEPYDSDSLTLSHPTTKYPFDSHSDHRKVNSHPPNKEETYHSTTARPNYSTTKQPDVYHQLNGIHHQYQTTYHPSRPTIKYTTNDLPSNLLTTSSPETFPEYFYTSVMPHSPKYSVTKQPDDKDQITTYHPPHRYTFTKKPSLSLHINEHLSKSLVNNHNPHMLTITPATLPSDNFSAARYQEVILNDRQDSSTPISHPRYLSTASKPSQYQSEIHTSQLQQPNRHSSAQALHAVHTIHGSDQQYLHNSYKDPRATIQPLYYQSTHEDPYQKHTVHHPEPLDNHQRHTQIPSQHSEISKSFAHFSTPKPIANFASQIRPVNEPHHKATNHGLEKYQDTPPQIYFSDVTNNQYSNAKTTTSTYLQYESKVTKEILGESDIIVTPNKNRALHDIPLISNPSIVAVTPRAEYGIQSPERIHTPHPSYPTDQPPNTQITVTAEPAMKLHHHIPLPKHQDYHEYSLDFPVNQNIIAITPEPNMLLHTPAPNYYGQSATISYIPSPTEVSIHHVHFSGDNFQALNSSSYIQTNQSHHDGSNSADHANGVISWSKQRKYHAQFNPYEHAGIPSQFSAFDDHLTHKLEIITNPQLITGLGTQTESKDESNLPKVFEPTYATSQQNTSVGSEGNFALTSSPRASPRRVKGGGRRVIKRKRSTTLSPLEANNRERMGTTPLPKTERELADAMDGLERTQNYYREQRQSYTDSTLRQEIKIERHKPIGSGIFPDSETSREKVSLLQYFPFRRPRKLYTTQSLAPRSMTSDSLDDLPDSYLQSLVDAGFGKKLNINDRKIGAPTGKKKRRPTSSSDTKGQEGSQKASNLEEVREYSLALYQHLQEQLKSRQLSTPRQRGRSKRRRVTRQTITPTEENVTEGGLNDMDIEDMLMQGMNFIPPVDPKQLRIALRELLQLVSNYKKKGILYPKSSGYSYLPSDKDGNGFGESISKELVTPASEKERLQKEGTAIIDASLSLEELNIDDDVEVNSYVITLPSSTPSTSAKQVAQEIPTAVDVSDDYVPVKQGEIDTLGRGTVKFQPSGRRRPFWGRRRRYKGYRHRCPDDETTTVTSQQPLVPPTIPSRPTIPELDFPGEPSSTIKAIPTQETPTTSSPGIPGAIPTTASTSGIPSATPTTPPSSSSPLPGNGNEDGDYNYEDYNGNDYDDYYVNFGDSDNGVDPGLTSEGVPANNGDPRTNNGGNGGNVPKSLDEGSVIILVEPDEKREINGGTNPKAFSQLKERRVSGSAIILVDSNDSRNNRNFERQYLSSKEGSAEGSAIILIDSDSNKSINERWRNIEISTSKEQLNSGSTIILVDPNSKKDSIPQEKSEKINQPRGSTIILVESNKDNVSNRENKPPSISRVSKETSNSAIILINPQDSSKTVSYKGAQSIEVENDGSVIILVEPTSDPSDSPPSNINTLNPTIKPLSSQLVAPSPSQSHVSLYANDLPPASISGVESPRNAQSSSARFESKGNLQGKQNEEEQSFVRSRTRRLRNEHQGNIILLAGPDIEHTFKRSQGIREEPDTTSRENIRNFQEPPRRQRGGQSSNSRNNRRQQNPRRRRKPSRFRDNVSGRNDFLLGLGRGRGSNSFRYRPNHSRENVRVRQDSSYIDYDTTDGRNSPRSDDSVGIRDEVNIKNQNREPRTRTRQLEQSRTREQRTEEPFQSSRDLTRGSRENFGETRTLSDREERREFSGSREGQRSDRRYYDSEGFSWLNPRSEEVTITRDDESIPEKIREIRESIEAKARAWTNFGLQRTRPEFRRTRRPALD